MADYDVAALGAGVAGLIAALRTARSGRSVALVTSHLLQPGDAPRIDAVPAQYLALLVELGVSPNAVGADLAPPFSRAAWECAASQSTPGPQTAHVERPALELALLALLRREHHATICFAPRLRPGQNLAASSWRASQDHRREPPRVEPNAGQQSKTRFGSVVGGAGSAHRRCRARPRCAVLARPRGGQHGRFTRRGVGR